MRRFWHFFYVLFDTAFLFSLFTIPDLGNALKIVAMVGAVTLPFSVWSFFSDEDD